MVLVHCLMSNFDIPSPQEKSPLSDIAKSVSDYSSTTPAATAAMTSSSESSDSKTKQSSTTTTSSSKKVEEYLAQQNHHHQIMANSCCSSVCDPRPYKYGPRCGQKCGLRGRPECCHCGHVNSMRFPLIKNPHYRCEKHKESPKPEIK